MNQSDKGGKEEAKNHSIFLANGLDPVSLS